jgi:hypothetical protein
MREGRYQVVAFTGEGPSTVQWTDDETEARVGACVVSAAAHVHNARIYDHGAPDVIPGYVPVLPVIFVGGEGRAETSPDHDRFRVHRTARSLLEQ